MVTPMPLVKVPKPADNTPLLANRKLLLRLTTPPPPIPPKPLMNTAFVIVALVRTPPRRVTVPLLTHAWAALSVAPLATVIEPFCVGATRSASTPLLTLTLPVLASTPLIVAPPLRMTSPELTNVLLTAPRNANVPVLVTGPLKKVLAVTPTVAALLNPPLKVAPATTLVSTPVPLRIINPLEYAPPLRSNNPPLMLADCVTVALPLMVLVPDVWM